MKLTVRRTGGKLSDHQILTTEDMREIGLLARERILRRTAAGKDATGASFRPYSEIYAARKAKELWASGSVDLTVSGDMLGSLVITDVSPIRVELGWTR